MKFSGADVVITWVKIGSEYGIIYLDLVGFSWLFIMAFI